VTTTKEDTQFDATDEAFFNAANDDAPVSERPITLDLEAEASESDEAPVDPAASDRLRARRERLTQAVAEIVATLALVSGTALVMHFVRGPAGSPRAAAASSPVAHATALSPAAIPSVTPMVLPPSAPVPPRDGGEMARASMDNTAVPSPAGVASPPSEQSHRSPTTRRARPASSDSAAQLRSALRRYRRAAAERATPGS